MSPLPVPVSPCSNTVASECATRSARFEQMNHLVVVGKNALEALLVPATRAGRALPLLLRRAPARRRKAKSGSSTRRQSEGRPGSTVVRARLRRPLHDTADSERSRDRSRDPGRAAAPAGRQAAAQIDERSDLFDVRHDDRTARLMRRRFAYHDFDGVRFLRRSCLRARRSASPARSTPESR